MQPQKNHKTLLAKAYEVVHKTEAPYYYNYTIGTIIIKPIRKWLNVSIIPYIPFNNIRIALYKLLGYKIGKNCFIGMRCYLDDMCYNLITIGNNVTISYGVYFACHGINQTHNHIVISDGAYIGMRATIIAPDSKGVCIGKNAIVGAMTLVNKDVPTGSTAVGVPCKIIDKSNNIK